MKLFPAFQGFNVYCTCFGIKTIVAYRRLPKCHVNSKGEEHKKIHDSFHTLSTCSKLGSYLISNQTPLSYFFKVNDTQKIVLSS